MRNRKAGRVLIAGGAGFLGSHLCDLMIRTGHHVVCLDSLLTGRRENLGHLEHETRFDLVEGDVVDPLPNVLTRTKFDRIYNLACAASPRHYQADPEHTMLTSVIGTHRLLVLAEKNSARFLLASTSEVYGDPESHPQTETYWGNVNPIGPRACYDEGKRAAETLTVDLHRARRVDARIARIFNTYGPRMRADDGRVVSNVICQALAGEDITVYGDGCQTRSFCYVDDMIDGLTRLMNCNAPLPGPVNLGNPDELTIDALVFRVLALTHAPSRIVNRPLPVDDPRRRRPDISRAQEYLGWTPHTALNNGLTPTVAWFTEEIGRTPAIVRPTASGHTDAPAATLAPR